MKKGETGFFGGSFNPVHAGHIGLAKWIADNAGLDSVWLSLSPSSPFKQHEMMLPDDLRLQLLKIAAAPHDSLYVTDIELSLPHPSYTIDALRHLTRLNPQKTFRLIIGADNVERFCHWKCWQEIAADFGLIVYPRPGYDFELPSFLLPYHHNVTILSGTPVFDVSSTEIRQRLISGKSIDGMVDPAVAAVLATVYSK